MSTLLIDNKKKDIINNYINQLEQIGKKKLIDKMKDYFDAFPYDEEDDEQQITTYDDDAKMRKDILKSIQNLQEKDKEQVNQTLANSLLESYHIHNQTILKHEYLDKLDDWRELFTDVGKGDRYILYLDDDKLRIISNAPKDREPPPPLKVYGITDNEVYGPKKATYFEELINNQMEGKRRNGKHGRWIWWGEKKLWLWKPSGKWKERVKRIFRRSKQKMAYAFKRAKNRIRGTISKRANKTLQLLNKFFSLVTWTTSLAGAGVLVGIIVAMIANPATVMVAMSAGTFFLTLGAGATGPFIIYWIRYLLQTSLSKRMVDHNPDFENEFYEKGYYNTNIFSNPIDIDKMTYLLKKQYNKNTKKFENEMMQQQEEFYKEMHQYIKTGSVVPGKRQNYQTQFLKLKF
tara:strand:- start:111 stop:1322 length:1212 start_codon:yes stop_codon:yes gene_type:complete